VDKSLVVRAFSILVENALDALPEGGLMLIRSETDENQCKIYIADQGVGISSGDLPYIFNPFYRTKPTGVGIDLAVVKQIMNRHGGRVEVESKPGEGTTFLLVFPLERRRPIRMSRLENYEDGFNRVKGTASEVIK
jgi:signal transduction histidine kinase